MHGSGSAQYRARAILAYPDCPFLFILDHYKRKKSSLATRDHARAGCDGMDYSDYVYLVDYVIPNS